MYYLYHADISSLYSGEPSIRASYHVVNCKHGVISLLVE